MTILSLRTLNKHKKKSLLIHNHHSSQNNLFKLAALKTDNAFISVTGRISVLPKYSCLWIHHTLCVPYTYMLLCIIVVKSFISFSAAIDESTISMLYTLCELKAIFDILFTTLMKKMDNTFHLESCCCCCRSTWWPEVRSSHCHSLHRHII